MSIQLLPFIPAAAERIVEFGCGDGALGKAVKERNPACRYFGVTESRRQAELADAVLDGVYVVDEERVEMPQIGILTARLDCIVYAGQLQRMKAPQAALRRHGDYLRPGGQVVASLDNPGYAGAVAGLLNGGGPSALHSAAAVIAMFAAAGLHVHEIVPCYGDEAESLRGDAQFAAALEILGRKNGGGPDARVWARGFLVRAVKGEPPRPILIQTLLGETAVCSRVRIEEPHAFLCTMPGWRAVNIETGRGGAFAAPRPGEDRIFIYQRVATPLPRAAEQVKALLRDGYLIVAEIDDDPLRWREHYERDRFFSFRGCHAVQTSTPALAAYLRQFNPHVAVFANQLAWLPPPRVYDRKQPVTIFFGALNREEDWKPLTGPLNEVLDRFRGKVRVKVIYDRQFFAALELEDKEFTPFCRYEQYRRILASSDIALLPLRQNRFNSMKSDLKYIECAANGVVALASPTVYQDTIKHGRTGFIYRSPQAFKEYLQMLIAEDGLREEIARLAYRQVRDERMLALRFQERARWYRRLIAQLPALNAELLARNTELRGDT